MVPFVTGCLSIADSSLSAAIHDDSESICAIWSKNNNWGDALNPVLIKLLSGKRPIRMFDYSLNIRKRPYYVVIGSILDNRYVINRSMKNAIIWGTGFISESGKLPGTPKKICAVRGPMTRKNLIGQGIECPEVYGDPALLYPKFYRPEIKPGYRLGIIPHYVDKKCGFIEKNRGSDEVKIIDIEDPINKVVDDICSCRHIASSSLHGVIAADAYGISSTWVKMSGGVIGNGFKFIDYFMSVGRRDREPLIINDHATVDDIYDNIDNYRIDIDLEALLDACPFYAGNVP